MTDTTLNNHVNIHWFQGSCHINLLSDALSAIETFVKDELWQIIVWEDCAGLNGFQSSHRWQNKIMVLFDIEANFSKRVHNNNISISFSGEFFDNMPFEKLSIFAETFDFLRVSRFDQYFQDTERTVEVFDILGAYKRGCCRGFRSRRYLDSDSNGTHSGETLELGRKGSSGSGKFLRIYDKDLESKGETPGIRWELVWSGKRAIEAWKIWGNNNFSAVTCAGMIFSVVDFVEPTDDSHRNRWKRLDWFQKLLDNIELITVPCCVESTCAEKKDYWVHDSVSGSLAYLRCYYFYMDGTTEGFDGRMSAYLDNGRHKLKKCHLVQLQKDIKAGKATSTFPVVVPSLEDLRCFFRENV